MRLGSTCSILLMQHIVNFSLVNQERRGPGRKQYCCTNNVIQFEPALEFYLWCFLLMAFPRSFDIFEHWLFGEQLHKLDNFSGLYRSHCVSSIANADILSGKRAFASVGLLWKASFGDVISSLSILIVTELLEYNMHALKAVYFPSFNHSTMEEFRETVDLLWVICGSYSVQGVVHINETF